MACKQNCKCGKVKSESIKENKKCMCRNGSCQGKCLTKFKLLKKDK